ncbi:unnamed protein product [Ranitomeya imitator]|uniref:Formin-binding protein 1-like n=1 Tax=Ranitomeya imitator TaxID=111125 RepID=A0ABN9KQS4_9NEOB|nr:unnamed protein product [Ranitomeya imitator]
MDERRTTKLSECYKGFADAERKVIPIISKCLEGMVQAAKSVDERRISKNNSGTLKVPNKWYMDSQIVVDCFKSGFEPPGDFPFEDYSQHIYRTVSDGTISTPKPEVIRIDPKITMGKAKGKLWLFGKKPKHTCEDVCSRGKLWHYYRLIANGLPIVNGCSKQTIPILYNDGAAATLATTAVSVHAAASVPRDALRDSPEMTLRSRDRDVTKVLRAKHPWERNVPGAPLRSGPSEATAPAQPYFVCPVEGTTKYCSVQAPERSERPGACALQYFALPSTGQTKYACAGAVAEDQKRTSWKEDGRRRSGPETPIRPDQQRDRPWDGNQGKHRVTKRGPALSNPMFTLVTGIVGRWRAVCVTALQRPNSDAAAIRIVVWIAAASFSVKGPALEDFSHLPPEQRRKKLQQRIDELNRELQKEIDQKEALNKMKDVYEKSPQMGDPSSLQPKIAETMSNIEKLRMEIHKNEGWLSEVEGKVAQRSERRHSAEANHLVAQGRESPEGSYTEDATQEGRIQPQPVVHTEFDDEFDDDDPLPAIGHCKAIYPFDGNNEGTLAMKEGEVMYIIEEDKGDGWTRARRQNGEEGYVPTSYIEITLEKNSKGAVTYI